MKHIRFVRLYKRLKVFTLGAAACTLLFSQSTSCLAVSQTAAERLEQQRAMTIESNLTEGWPTGPVVNAKSAILMEAETGTILYAKDIHSQEYPASTTKILTCLIAAERCSLDEWVTFSYSAVHDTPKDSNHIAMDVGEKLTMEDCLNAILIRSANEVAYAVGEHIAGTGSWEDFAAIMNERATELGCLNSNFVNPNGLPDENHYTTAYDLAMIGRAFFANELLCKISTTKQLRIEPTEYQTDLKVENSSNQMLAGRTYAYEYLVGAKTGYTNAARSTLVTCAEKDGLKLICVVLKDESPYQYEDTIALFNYGFSNFEKIKVSEVENKYDIDNSLFYSENAIFGSSQPILSMDTTDCIILPKTASLEDVSSSISYDTADANQVAEVTYTYQGVTIGSAAIRFAASSTGYSFDSVTEVDEEEPVTTQQAQDKDAETDGFPYKDWLMVLGGALAIMVVIIIVLLLRTYLSQFHFQFSLPRFFTGKSRWQSPGRRERIRAERRRSLRHREDIKRAKSRQRRKHGRNIYRDYD